MKKLRPFTVTAARMREIERRADAEFGISSRALMENAGRAVAREILGILDGAGEPQGPVWVYCGRGNNGADGLVAARHLRESGVRLKAFLLEPRDAGGYRAELRERLDALRRLAVEPETLREGREAPRPEGAKLVLDAVLGAGSSGGPTGGARAMIAAIAAGACPVASVDIPSGLDPDTGDYIDAVVRARWTLALGAAKLGLMNPRAADVVGELRVLDIGLPPALMASMARAGAA